MQSIAYNSRISRLSCLMLLLSFWFWKYGSIRSLYIPQLLCNNPRSWFSQLVFICNFHKYNMVFMFSNFFTFSIHYSLDILGNHIFTVCLRWSLFCGMKPSWSFHCFFLSSFLSCYHNFSGYYICSRYFPKAVVVVIHRALSHIFWPHPQNFSKKKIYSFS